MSIKVGKKRYGINDKPNLIIAIRNIYPYVYKLIEENNTLAISISFSQIFIY